ncbi:MAG: DEAD/DEAH box helicase [Candidatus Odinarchaeota archaeon]
MPLIGTPTTGKNSKTRLTTASHIKKRSKNIKTDSPSLDEPVVSEVELVNSTAETAISDDPLLPIIKEISVNSPSDWSTAVECAAGKQYETVDVIEQPVESIEQGIAVNELREWLPPRLMQLLRRKGIDKLHRFQTEALKLILGAEDAVITAPTGTGKTEAFLLPVIARYYTELRESGRIVPPKELKVLVIYPTKALAADQHSKFARFLKTGDFRVEVFDGDTSQVQRKKIINDPPTVLITNMDILHYNLRKEEFRHLIRTVETVIIDEVHVYESVLGTNLKWILERLERLVNGQYFQAIAASATVANAEEFVSMLIRRPVRGCHCKQGRRTSVIHALVTRSTSNFQTRISDRLRDNLAIKASFIISLALSTGSKVLVFEDSRRGAEELFMRIQKTAFKNLKVSVHHAGLSTQTRRRSEDSFKSGNLQVLIATPTMELGIDIGDIDIIVSSPVPVNRLLQRFGRGGRRGQSCLAVTDLSGNSPVNEYYRRNPEEFLQTPSTVYFDPGSEKIALYHLLAAALDLPLAESEVFTKKHVKLVRLLVEQYLLAEQADGTLAITDSGRETLKSFNLRGIDESVRIVLKKVGMRAKSAGQQYSTLTTREKSLAIREFYPGAVVLVGGQAYLSKDYDQLNNRVTVVPFPRTRKQYLTRAKVNRQVVLYRNKKLLNEVGATYLTDVTIITTVDSYIRIHYGAEEETMRGIDLAEPLVHEMRTRGLVINVAPVLAKGGLMYDYQEWHGLAHLIIAFAGLVIGTRGLQDLDYSIERDQLVIHEKTNGGRGIVRTLQTELATVLEKGLENLIGCNCSIDSGCPNCLFLHGCREKNKGLIKEGTEELTKILLALLEGNQNIGNN